MIPFAYGISMKLLRIGMLGLLLVVSACGLLNPQDGTVVVYGTFVGAIPVGVRGVRLVADSEIYPVNNYDSRDDVGPTPLPREDIAEAVFWTDAAFRASHHARGDSSTIRTTFTLKPDNYGVHLQQMLPPLLLGGEYSYEGIGSDSSRPIKVYPRKTITVRLRGTFD